MGETAPQEELGILFPDRDVEVRDPDTGEPAVLTVREFRFREGLEAQALARPLTGRLADMVAGDEPPAEEVVAMLGEHAELWLRLVGMACGRDADWLGRLSDKDGDAVSEAMWDANRDFLFRRAVAEVARRRRREQAGSRSPKSSTPSSGPDTDADTAT